MHGNELRGGLIFAVGLFTASCTEPPPPPPPPPPDNNYDPRVITALQANRDIITKVLANKQLSASEVVWNNLLNRHRDDPTVYPNVFYFCQTRSYQTPLAEATDQLEWPVYGSLMSGFTKSHQGVDIAPSFGTPIKAADGGKVAAVIQAPVGYGTHILLSHGSENATLYAHLSSANVELGDKVAKGSEIGKVGSTGNSTGPHLHLEIIGKDCTLQDPLDILPRGEGTPQFPDLEAINKKIESESE